MRLTRFVEGFWVGIFFLLVGCSSPSEQSNATISGKYVPPNGQRLLFVGQDSDTISDYQKAVPHDLLEGVTLYTQLKSADPRNTLFGLDKKGNWNSGNVDFQKTLASASHAALAVGLAFDSCNQVHHGAHIVNGDYDDAIHEMVDWFKALSPRPIFLRIGYEFDGPWNCYQKATYKEAFKRIAAIIKQKEADNIVTVWQSATWPDPTIAGDKQSEYDHRLPDHLSSWYPGNESVDWIALSSFYRDLHQWNYVPVDTPAASQDKVLAFARKMRKPVMIAEAAPQAYNLSTLTKGFISLNDQRSVTPIEIWRQWYEPLFGFVEDNKDVVKALAYINTHWESQALWRCDVGASAGTTECPQGYWGDTRVQANPYILEKWLEETQDESAWVQGVWW